jgi:hypothetical protein
LHLVGQHKDDARSNHINGDGLLCTKQRS